MTVRIARRGTMAGRGAIAVTNVLNLPGTSGNYASIPDSAAHPIGDIDIRAWVALVDWASAGTQDFLAKFVGAGTRSFIFRKEAGTSNLQLVISADGTVNVSALSTAATGFSAGTAHWVRATWRNSDDRTQFFTSEDGASWTQLGADVTLSATGIFDSTSSLEIGSQNGGTANLLNGKVYKVELRDGIDGTLVASFDATAVTKLGTRNPTTAPNTGTQGGNWTLNGSAWDWTAP